MSFSIPFIPYMLSDVIDQNTLSVRYQSVIGILSLDVCLFISGFFLNVIWKIVSSRAIAAHVSELMKWNSKHSIGDSHEALFSL